MNKFKLVILILLATIGRLSLGQDDPSRPDLKQLQQQGKMISLQIALGEPLRIFVLGKEKAKVDMNDLKVAVRFFSKRAQPWQDLVPDGDHFTVKSRPNEPGPTKLEVKTRLNDVEEVFNFNLK